jgi:hypothetical protein
MHRPTWLETTPRPATRAHSRNHSYSHNPNMSPRPPKDSPRYNSSGQYSTQDVSYTHFSSSRRPSGSSHNLSRPSMRDRRSSYSYVRSSTPYGESDEDEIIETKRGTFVLPAQSRSHQKGHHHDFLRDYDGVRYTNIEAYPQDGTFFHDPVAQQREPVYEPSAAASRRAYPPSALHTRAPTSMGQRPRRSSASVPQRPSTVRPMAAVPARHPRPVKSKAPKTGPREVTEADLVRHRIPQGYSTKNWDPDEDPILLLGSVFDANTLGKWIYDWTVYEHKAGSPLSDMAGQLWLQMISVFSKIRSAEEVIGSVRRPDRREMLDDFIDTGEDIVARLRFILKACEAPMLRTAKKNGSGLGESAGSSFVHSLFGRERQLPRLENLMHRMDLFDQRWEQNCADIVSRPTL